MYSAVVSSILADAVPCGKATLHLCCPKYCLRTIMSGDFLFRSYLSLQKYISCLSKIHLILILQKIFFLCPKHSAINRSSIPGIQVCQIIVLTCFAYSCMHPADCRKRDHYIRSLFQLSDHGQFPFQINRRKFSGFPTLPGWLYLTSCPAERT